MFHVVNLLFSEILKDATCNVSRCESSFNENTYNEFMETDEWKIFSKYKLPICFSRKANPLANKLVMVYFFKCFVNSLKKNPYFSKFLERKVITPGCYVSEKVALKVEDRLMPGSFNDRFHDKDNDKFYYFRCYSQLPFEIFFKTNEVRC